MPSLVGNKPNQVPSNGDLGTLAFQDANAVNIQGGIVDVSAGTAALPTLGTVGDPDTGVFFPAANTVAVSTNGVERVRVDGDGNLGIGTGGNPTFRLQVETSANGNAGAFIRNSNTGNTASGNLTVASSVGALNLRAFSAAHSAWANSTQIVSDAAFTGGLTILQGGANPISLWTNSSERMRIDASGNVGIGTTANASAILDAQSTTKGVRMPNMTTTQKNAIASPAAGLMIFDTTLAKLCVYSGTAWQTITSV
jgi:hypothetical protein